MEEIRKQFECEWTKTMEHLAEQPEMQVWKNVCWNFWESSRAAIELDLPPRKSAYASGYGDGYLVEQQGGEAIDHDETVEILRAAGLRVKEK